MAEKAHEKRQKKESPESRQEIELILYNSANCAKHYNLLRILFTILKPIATQNQRF